MEGVVGHLKATNALDDLTSIYFTNANIGYAVGKSMRIRKTIDGGNNWFTPYSTITYYNLSELNSVYFTDANTGYVVGGKRDQYGQPSVGGIMKTTDGGVNWTQPVSNTKYLNSVYFTNANTGYAVGINGTILKTGTSGVLENSAEEHIYGSSPNIYFYPNPASEIVTLNFENINNADFTLNIYNVIGKLISSETLRYNHQQINIGDLSNGIYIVEIKSKEWSGKQKLIIKR